MERNHAGDHVVDACHQTGDQRKADDGNHNGGGGNEAHNHTDQHCRGKKENGAANYKDVDNNGKLAVATKDSTVSVQEVVKKGSNATELELGDKVLVRDNTTTSIMIEGVQYNTVNRDMIVGKFRGESNEYTVGNLEALLGTYVLMIDNQAVYALEGSNILNPDYDFDTDVDSMSEVWTDRYEVLMSNIDELKVGDLVFVPREALNYVTLRGRRYFVAYDKDFMLARITKDKNQERKK